MITWWLRSAWSSLATKERARAERFQSMVFTSMPGTKSRRLAELGPFADGQVFLHAIEGRGNLCANLPAADLPDIGHHAHLPLGVECGTNSKSPSRDGQESQIFSTCHVPRRTAVTTMRAWPEPSTFWVKSKAAGPVMPTGQGIRPCAPGGGGREAHTKLCCFADENFAAG